LTAGYLVSELVDSLVYLLPGYLPCLVEGSLTELISRLLAALRAPLILGPLIGLLALVVLLLTALRAPLTLVLRLITLLLAPLILVILTVSLV
jgi:hypothetical protein